MSRAVKVPITVSMDPGNVQWVDGLVAEGAYESRSAATEAAFAALHRERCDAQFEAALAALTPEDVAEGMAQAEEGMADYSRLVLETTDWEPLSS